MSRSHNEERFSDDLQGVADVLRDQRPALTPLELDRVKLRAMSGARRSTSPRKGFFMRSRLTALLTVGFLAAGTGGALATFGGGDFGFGGDHGGSASWHQYRPPCDRGFSFGDDHHCHPIPPPPRCDHGFSLGSDGHCHGQGGNGGQGGDKGGQGGSSNGGQGGDKGGQGGGKGGQGGGSDGGQGGDKGGQ